MISINSIDMDEFIICAAIKIESLGKIWYGHRYNHCISAINDELSWEMSRMEITKFDQIKGFITNKNRFVDRIEALDIAKRQKQLKSGWTCSKDKLYSEDLY